MAEPLTRRAAVLANIVPADPLEVSELFTETRHSGSPISAAFVSPSALAMALDCLLLPPALHADRPLEIGLAAVGTRPCARAAALISRRISVHARLSVVIETVGRSRVSHCVPITARLSRRGWIARALILPLSWADAATITVLAFTFAGRPVAFPLQCE